MDKRELRRQIREKKQQMTPEQIALASSRLGEMFIATEQYRRAKTIYGYLPYNQEVHTTAMLVRALQEGKRVAVPKIFGDEMKFIYITDLSQVEKGYRGIPEPVANEPVANDPTALVLMPGVAFTKNGDRIGYGGGYYDKFLAREPEHPTVALCYDFQIVETLPTQEHDIPVELVLWAK